LVRLFFIRDNERRARHWGDPYFSWTCNDHLVTDFREILRINARAKIDSSRGKNIRGPASITAQGGTDDAAVGTSFLSKICDLKEVIFRDCDCERRSCNDLAPESARKNETSMQEKEGSQPPAEMDFDCHRRGGRMGKLESIVVTSTIGVDRRQFWRRTNYRLGKAHLTGA
jgi:hypothetical protein